MYSEKTSVTSITGLKAKIEQLFYYTTEHLIHFEIEKSGPSLSMRVCVMVIHWSFFD